MSKHSLIVVDDDKDDMQTLCDALQEAGVFEISYKCVSLPSLLRALKLSVPDAIICNMDMRPDNGLNICRAIKAAEYASIPIIFLSEGEPPGQIMKELTTFNITDILVKPDTLKGYRTLCLLINQLLS